MLSVEGDLMIWANPRAVILYARSSYFYNNMFIICLFPTFYKLFWSLIQKKIVGTFAITLHFMTSHHHVFRRWLHAYNLLYVTLQQKQVTHVSLVFKG